MRADAVPAPCLGGVGAGRAVDSQTVVSGAELGLPNTIYRIPHSLSRLSFTEPLKGRVPGFTNEETEARSGYVGHCNSCCLGDKVEPLPRSGAAAATPPRPGLPTAPACPARPPAIAQHHGLPAQAGQGGWATLGCLAWPSSQDGKGPWRAGDTSLHAHRAVATSSSEKPPLPPALTTQLVPNHSWARAAPICSAQALFPHPDLAEGKGD